MVCQRSILRGSSLGNREQVHTPPATVPCMQHAIRRPVRTVVWTVVADDSPALPRDNAGPPAPRIRTSRHGGAAATWRYRTSVWGGLARATETDCRPGAVPGDLRRPDGIRR